MTNMQTVADLGLQVIIDIAVAAAIAVAADFYYCFSVATAIICCCYRLKPLIRILPLPRLSAIAATIITVICYC